ncbi:MAG: RNA-binding cell elongation regulator Jag/EloR [Bacillota bacterium]|nr:protein jag [Bacillota bacterium]MDW7729038.1 RNA-binding cell elongation regulator Jag/EloR [Bacillota bacterium]
MSDYEATGRTTDEAVEKALSSLGIRKENAKIEIMDEPSQGLLGILGNKNARVLVTPILEPEEYLDKYLKEMLLNMGIEGSVNVVSDDEKLEAMILGDDVGVLIGRRGKTLSDMQYLINVVMRRQFSNLNKMTVIDIENYRARREKTLTQLARNVARKVSHEGYEQALEPMTPQERRIIHIALQDYPGVTTYSAGQEPYRKVIIAPN